MPPYCVYFLLDENIYLNNKTNFSLFKNYIQFFSKIEDNIKDIITISIFEEETDIMHQLLTPGNKKRIEECYPKTERRINKITEITNLLNIKNIYYDDSKKNILKLIILILLLIILIKIIL